MGWYRVVSPRPVCVDHANGSVVAYPKGKVFEADPNLPDIRNLLRSSPVRLVNVPAPDVSDPNIIPAPGASYPLPPAKSPLPAPVLPPGIHDIVKVDRSTSKKS